MTEVVKVYDSVIYKLPPFFGPIIRILIILAIGFIVIKISGGIINRVLTVGINRKTHINESKRKTLISLLKSIVRYLTYFVMAVNILEILGVNTASILTAAGVGGLAVGFGAQSLVKDLISGFFIIFEDQFNVGDYVEAGGVAGTVEEMSIRATKLRDFGGQLHIIPNGEISIVTNHSRGAMRALVDVRIAYEEDIDRAIDVLEDVCKQVKNKRKDILEGPKVLGVSNLDSSGVNLTIYAKTSPMQQWSVEREIRKLIKERLQREGIEIPYHKMEILSKNKNAKKLDKE